MRTGNPVACEIAAAAQDVATAALARKGVTAGCEWVVEKVDNAIRIRVQADAKGAAEARKAQDALEKSKDVRFKARGVLISRALRARGRRRSRPRPRLPFCGVPGKSSLPSGCRWGGVG